MFCIILYFRSIFPSGFIVKFILYGIFVCINANAVPSIGQSHNMFKMS